MKLVDDVQAVGSLRSRQGVIVRPEISGRITQLNFQDGGRVKKGQLLVQLDDQLPMAQVQQAVAERSIAVANHKRNQDLVEQNFISRRTVDESAAALQVAEAKLALAQASAARLKILAPFDGMAGIRMVNVGDYLKDGADIVNIEDIEAIFVDYRLPERFQSKVRRGQTAAVELDALPGRQFTSVLQAIDPLIDANGRSVGVRACIDNRRLQLRPGMFARVTTVFGQREEARVIPEEAIVPQAGKQFVIKLLPGPDGQGFVTQRVEVKVGQRLPGKVEIVDGLDVGETVVIAGQQRVQRDGTAVRVLVIAAAPTAPAAPKAAASPKLPASALAPLTGPDPCRAGMADAASPSAKPMRKSS
jgi:membrane fusion protein (multidrug efflux system)